MSSQQQGALGEMRNSCELRRGSGAQEPESHPARASWGIPVNCQSAVWCPGQAQEVAWAPAEKTRSRDKDQHFPGGEEDRKPWGHGGGSPLGAETSGNWTEVVFAQYCARAKCHRAVQVETVTTSHVSHIHGTPALPLIPSDRAT